MIEQNDHDVLVTLVANVTNLKESQEAFHREMKESLADLKVNYSARLDAHATRFNQHEIRFNNLESSNTRQNVMLTIGTSILVFLTGLMVWHVLGKPL